MWRWRESILGSFGELREPVAFMLRKRSKWRSHKDLSTNGRNWGRATRTSDECLVMRQEQRGGVVCLEVWGNQKWEEPKVQAKL